MAGGRKRHRHTGREFSVTWLAGSGPQVEAPALQVPAWTIEAEIERLDRDLGAPPTRSEPLQLVDREDEMDEHFATLDRRAAELAESPSGPGPTPVRMECPPSPVPSNPVQREPSSRALQLWRTEHREEFGYLLFLQQFEPDRHAKALTSIDQGRGHDVAVALKSWYLAFRNEHGWDIRPPDWHLDATGERRYWNGASWSKTPHRESDVADTRVTEPIDPKAHIFKPSTEIVACVRCQGTGSYYDSEFWREDGHGSLPEAGVCYDCAGSGVYVRSASGSWEPADPAAAIKVPEAEHWQVEVGASEDRRALARALTHFRFTYGADAYSRLLQLRGEEPMEYVHVLQHLKDGRHCDADEELTRMYSQR